MARVLLGLCSLPLLGAVRDPEADRSFKHQMRAASLRRSGFTPMNLRIPSNAELSRELECLTRGCRGQVSDWTLEPDQAVLVMVCWMHDFPYDMPRLASSTADSRPRSTCCCGAWSLYRFATFVIAHSTTAHSAVYVSIKRTLRETFLRAGSRPHPAGGDKGCRLGASGMFAEDMYRPPYVL